MPFGRVLNLCLFMWRDGADAEHLETIEELLTPPPSWRDPVTGLPAGFSDNEDDDWADWEAAIGS